MLISNNYILGYSNIYDQSEFIELKGTFHIQIET